ncbi:hypothetical protein V6N11_071323 [Hibiscus sabdariffa]|uniref:Uncharacterized protein n=1 Tax=Hibiscus sabdariffa TaxID=183260 RepID=A0ABR2TZV8_9ROSI
MFDVLEADLLCSCLCLVMHPEGQGWGIRWWRRVVELNCYTTQRLSSPHLLNNDPDGNSEDIDQFKKTRGI